MAKDNKIKHKDPWAISKINTYLLKKYINLKKNYD